jgi:hypothetical protein
MDHFNDNSGEALVLMQREVRYTLPAGSFLLFHRLYGWKPSLYQEQSLSNPTQEGMIMYPGYKEYFMIHPGLQLRGYRVYYQEMIQYYN